MKENNMKTIKVKQQIYFRSYMFTKVQSTVEVRTIETLSSLPAFFCDYKKTTRIDASRIKMKNLQPSEGRVYFFYHSIARPVDRMDLSAFSQNKAKLFSNPFLEHL